MMKITVVLQSSGNSFTVEMDKEAPVAELKQTIHSITGVPPEQYILATKKLIDTNTLEQSGITEDSRVHLLQPPGTSTAVQHNAEAVPITIAV